MQCITTETEGQQGNSYSNCINRFVSNTYKILECGPMPNVMAAQPNMGGALCSTPQSLADAQYWSAVQ